MYYNECPNCGATLDPGEKCDCLLEQNEHIHIRRVQYATKAEWLKARSTYQTSHTSYTEVRQRNT